MKDLYFITSNKGKSNEATNRLIKEDIKVIQKNLGYPEIQANSLEDVVNFGVNYIIKKFHKPFIIEDAGIFIEAFNGFPGPYSKFVFNTVGLKGILKLMDSVENRNAYFMSVVAFGSPQEQPTCFVGKVNGKIGLQQKGNSGFGYDPIFIPDDSEGRTFAELTVNEKNWLSHRGKALRLFAEWYSSQNERRF